MPLELFFDLVFVLALTQCTALMTHDPSAWAGIGKGVLVLALLWWAWSAYAWLTSVVDPEEGGVRLVLVGAMAALLIAALRSRTPSATALWSSRSPTAPSAPRTSGSSCSPATTTPSCAARPAGSR